METSKDELIICVEDVKVVNKMVKNFVSVIKIKESPPFSASKAKDITTSGFTYLNPKDGCTTYYPASRIICVQVKAIDVNKLEKSQGKKVTTDS